MPVIVWMEDGVVSGGDRNQSLGTACKKMKMAIITWHFQRNCKTWILASVKDFAITLLATAACFDEPYVYEVLQPKSLNRSSLWQ